MRVAAIFLVGLFSACAPGAREVDDVREATFRHLFTKDGSAHPQSAKVYCLSVDGQDPTADFMARFAGNRPPVKKGSLCSESTGQGVLDKETGERGIAFRLAKVTIKWGSRAEVEGGYFEHGFSAGSHIYHLEKVGGVWRVVKAVQGGPLV